MANLQFMEAAVVALLSALLPTAVAIWIELRRNNGKLQEFHIQLNSRFDEMKATFLAQGKAEEREEQDARDAAKR